LKLVCIPPTIGQEGDFGSQDQGPDTSQPLTGALHVLQHVVTQPEIVRHANPPLQPHHSYLTTTNYSVNNMRGYADDPRLAHPQPYIGSTTQDQRGLYVHDSSLQMGMPSNQAFQHPQPPVSNMYSIPPVQASSHMGSEDHYEQSTAKELSEALGELRIDETGVGSFVPYLRSISLAATDVSAIL
jgi:hypothetical protein